MRRSTMKFFLLIAVMAIASLVMPAPAITALLDVGPVVTQELNSTPPEHGFPLWYRDTNRVPLELCLSKAASANGAMCLTAEPNPGAPFSFPDNIGDEVFWWAAGAQMAVPGGGNARLDLAIEGAYSTGDVVPGAQISFARVRVRVDTPSIGTYTITHPYGELEFNVTADTLEDGINFTEDVGIAEGGIFTGALNGKIGPFLYCTNAPIIVGGESFVGDPNVPCSVLGSTFPSAQNPSNFFRVRGPNGLDIQTTQFNVMGKIYTDPIPTPLTVDKATYARDTTGMQVNVFATTEALSNQTNQLAQFPANFTLTGAASALQVTGAGIPTKDLTTNNPADGKFFSASGLFATPGSMPATVTVTNTADTPVTSKEVPLVDEVVIEAATYNNLTKTLSITASSYDKVALPALQAFMPGMEAPLGTLTDGQLVVTFPVTDNSVNPAKTYAIPPATVTVVSANGGTNTIPVVTFLPKSPVSTILSPVANTTFTGTSQVFTWDDTGAALYQLHVGTARGAQNLGRFPASPSTATTTTVTGLPTDGSSVYVRLYSQIDGVWYFNDYTYTAATINKATMTSPTMPFTFTGNSQAFTWNDTGAALYQLHVGTTGPGSQNLGRFPATASNVTSATVTGLPINGNTVYVRLYSQLNGVWYFNDYSYTAATITPATMTSPTMPFTFTGNSQAFTWNDTGATLYQLHVGTTGPGSQNLGRFPATASNTTNTTVTGLPINGSTVYVRLYSQFGGIWYFKDYTYTATGP